MPKVKLNVNGTDHEVEVQDGCNRCCGYCVTSSKLVGTKFGCGMAQCGACTVHVNGAPMRSCSVPAPRVVGKKITTIEGLAQNGALTAVQKAWIDHDVPQCGYCQAGQIMSATALLRDKNESFGRRYRHCHAGQHLPLRHVCPHPRSHQVSSQGTERERLMNAMNSNTNTCRASSSNSSPREQSGGRCSHRRSPCQRRNFMKVTAGVGGGLRAGLRPG